MCWAAGSEEGVSLANRGMGLQALLDTVHAGYQARGVAAVLPLFPPIEQLAGYQPLSFKSGGPRGRRRTANAFPAVFKGEGPPDYAVVSGGYTLLVDAKDCEADRWPLSHLPEHQALAFDRHVAQRGHAGILLRTPAGMWYLPWTHTAEAPRLSEWWHRWNAGEAPHGFATMTEAHLDALGCRLRTADWLPAALKIARGAP